jgi:hypothetical protein
VRRIRRLTVPLALLLVLGVAPAMSGCSVQSLVENATGGTVDVGGKSVPKDFPADVPLIDGEVIYGAAVGPADARVWNVTVTVADVAAIDTISSQLSDAGFTAPVAPGTTANGAAGAFDGEKYGVLVAVTPDADNGFVANYTVTTKK